MAITLYRIRFFQKFFLAFSFGLLTTQVFALENTPLKTQVDESYLPVQNQDAGARKGFGSLVPHDRKTSPKPMKVLVFPHTLKNDGRHGTPDDPQRVAFSSPSPMTLTNAKGETSKAKRFQLEITQKGLFQIQSEKNLKHNLTSEANLKGDAPITVHRVENPDLSHSYKGTFHIVAKKRRILVINRVSMEEYVRGVVPSEVVPTWPLESQKAQAVAARTYARYHQATGNRDLYHVDDTARFQVYTGLDHATSRTNRAVNETQHEIMTYKGQIPVAYFHAYSGGRTDSAKNIFRQDNVPYCQPKDELFERHELLDELPSGAHWIVNWTTDSFSSQKLLKKWQKSDITRRRFIPFRPNQDIELSALNYQPEFDSIRTLEVRQLAQKATLKFHEVRSSLGWSEFPSYHFRLEQQRSGDWAFQGHGWGHHVGMSQWGAFFMAKNLGSHYREILHHYYTDIEITRLGVSL